MTDDEHSVDPEAVQRRIGEAKRILANLELPPAQQSEMCALVLLALLDLSPHSSWSSAMNPLRGIKGIRNFCIAEYGRGWAENTRESVRKTALHYFQAAGFVAQNPDNPERATNNKNFAYQITPDALALFQSFGTEDWSRRLADYLISHGSLTERFAARRTIETTPLRIIEGQMLTLSPGKHSDLIEQIVQEFGRRFTRGGKLLYAGDTGRKWGYFDKDALEDLGVTIKSKGAKMPDVIIYHEEENWLVIVEAFTSVGPIDPIRKEQLEQLFADSKAPLVLVTAFPDRKTMARKASELAWETDVWIADAPDHLIHYNGERFLGPYE